MKKMTFAVWFTALLAVFTFSSCLDDEGENSYPLNGYVKVDGYPGSYYFMNQLNQKFVPTNQNILPANIDSEYAFIIATANQNQQESTKETPILLQGCAFSQRSYLMPVNESMKEFANAPIALINSGTIYNIVPVGFWNPTTMFIPVYYFLKGSANQSEDQAEKNSHSFTFYYKVGQDANVISSSDDDMVICVRHHVINSELNKDRKNLAMDLFQLDLTDALHAFGLARNGKKPEKIFIEYESNEGSGIYDSKQSSNVQINYSDLLRLFDKK